jgi:ubiquitin-protein ligase
MCNTVEEGYKLFESDSFLSLSFRPSTEPFPITDETIFKSLASRDFISIPPPIKYPNQTKFKPANVKNLLINIEAAKIGFSKSQRSLRFRRIVKELSSLNKHPNPYITIYPCEADIEFWNGVIRGPQDTVYEGGKFQIFIRFGDEYPEKPPEIRFITPIYHININSTGRICISILGSDYRSDLSIRNLLISVYGLLLAPEGSDTLDTNLAHLYNEDKVKFDNIARHWTTTKANKSEEDLIEGIVDANKVDDVPDEFKCACSGRLMIDPVICNLSQYTYEKEVIEKIIDDIGFDPISKHPITRANLVPNAFLKKQIKAYRNFEGGNKFE